MTTPKELAIGKLIARHVNVVKSFVPQLAIDGDQYYVSNRGSLLSQSNVDGQIGRSLEKTVKKIIAIAR